MKTNLFTIDAKRNQLFLFALLLCFGFSIHAQKIEITPQFGYQVGAKWNYYGGYVKLKSSEHYGFTLDLSLSDNLQAEFFWAQENAAVAVKDFILYPREEEVGDARVDHFQFGLIHTFGYGDAKPFLGMSAGWSTFSPDANDFRSNSSFSLGFTGGLKYFFSDHLGIRLQGQLLMPVEWGGVYIGTGGSGVTTGGSILQLNFSGGLIIAL